MNARLQTAHRVTKYAQNVRAGRIVAGPLVRLACERHLRDLKAWGSAKRKGRPFYFDTAAASRAIDFFEHELVLADMLDEDGDPTPFIVQDWQAFILGSVFGWKKADGHRRFRTAYIETGKGSGKTPLGAGIGLYCLVADGQAYPEVYSAAVSQKQANITWEDARRMVAGAPRLRKYVEASAHALRGRGDTGGKFEAISSEYRALQGKRPHCAIIDEVHEHPNRQVVTQMRRGTKRNQDAVIVELTNSGYDRESVCYEHHEYSRRVLEQMIEADTWFAYVCGLDEGDSFTDRAVWPKANPNIGITIDWSYLQEAVDEAVGMPAAEADVRRLNFCEWVEKQSNFIPSKAWLAGRRETPPDLEGVSPIGAIDLGLTDDMSAFALVWRLSGERYYARVWYFVPEAAIKARPHRPWNAWRKSPHLTVHEGDVTDFAQMRQAVSRIASAAGCRTIAFDKRFAVQLAQELKGEGFLMIDTPQGFYLNEATRKMEALIKAGDLLHDGDPITNWQASNVVVTRGTRGDIRPDKERSGDKIDGIVATIMALGRAALQGPKKQSRYAQPGARVEAVTWS